MARRISNADEQLPRGIFIRPPGSGIYWIRYADSTGRERKEKAGPRLKTAVTLYNKRKTEAIEGRKLPHLNRREILFSELAADFLEHSHQRHTVQTCERNCQRMPLILATFGQRPAAQIAPADLARFLDNPKWMPATRNRYRAQISACYSLALRNEKLEVNPAKKVRLWRENNARVRFLEGPEERRLRSSVAALGSNRLAELDLAINTGMRQGEQWKLRWRDIDLKRNILTVANSKNGTSRHIPLNAEAVAALKHLKGSGRDSDYVIPGPEGERVRDFRRWFHDAVFDARIKNFHWHDLRHTFASRLVMAGSDMRTVQDLLGHKVIAMTVRYSHLAEPHKRKAVASLPQTGAALPEGPTGAPTAPGPKSQKAKKMAKAATA